MGNVACSTAEALINSVQAFGCKSIREQELAIIGYLAAIAEGVGNAPGGVSCNSSNGAKTGAGDVVGVNTNRTDFQIQNQSVNALFVKFGTGCTTNNFDMVLSAASVANNGTGGFYANSGYTGIVSVNGTLPSYTFSEFVANP
jgi:hypothetical protein